MKWEKWQEFLKERVERIDRDSKRLEELEKKDAKESLPRKSQFILEEIKEWIDIFNFIERDSDISPKQRFVIRGSFRELMSGTRKRALELREFLQKELNRIRNLNEIERILTEIQGIREE